MTSFGLPKVTEILTEINGNQIQGSYSIILGDLTVYYHGETSSIPKPENDLEQTAEQLLKQLYLDHYYDIKNVPADLPEPIRIAAANYVNSDPEDQMLILELLISISESIPESAPDKRISYFIYNSLNLIVPFWELICEKDNRAEQIYQTLGEYLKNPATDVDWEAFRKPIIGYDNGQKIEDCDLNRLEPIANSLVECAEYFQTGKIENAVKCADLAWAAQAEGCWPREASRSFEVWLVEVALPKSIQLELLN